MYAARLINPLLILHFLPQCLLMARDFLLPPDRLHRLSVVIVAVIVAALMACFVAFAYAEKFQLVDNFFYGKLKFSFIDGGYPESFGYALEFIACVIFAVFASSHLKKQWYAWSAILFVTFLDDAFRLHESAGHFYADIFNLSAVGGDLLGFATTGLISLVLWFWGVVKITNERDLSAYLVFTGYYALLILFGVVVDAVHGVFGENMSQTLFTLVEDGGELVTIAIICLSAYGMWARGKKIPYEQESGAITPAEPLKTGSASKTF